MLLHLQPPKADHTYRYNISPASTPHISHHHRPPRYHLQYNWTTHQQPTHFQPPETDHINRHHKSPPPPHITTTTTPHITTATHHHHTTEKPRNLPTHNPSWEKDCMPPVVNQGKRRRLNKRIITTSKRIFDKSTTTQPWTTQPHTTKRPTHHHQNHPKP